MTCIRSVRRISQNFNPNLDLLLQLRQVDTCVEFRILEELFPDAVLRGSNDANFAGRSISISPSSTAPAQTDFYQADTIAGGFFGSGGPRALQFAARLEFQLDSMTKELNLPVVDEADASPEVAKLYARFRETFGRPKVPAILTCFATHPPLLEHMLGLAESMLFTDGALGRANKEMLATFVSARNNCEYCADSHGYSLRMNGGSTDMLAAAMNWDVHSKSIDPAQASLLAFVQKVTDDSQSITSDDVSSLRAVGWSNLQMAEAIHMAALFACFNRVVNGFGLPSQGMLATTGEML